MGDSDKLVPSGPDRYHFAEQRDHLFALLDSLDLGERVVLVLHDWGSALGFDWAKQHRDRVQGIAYMEAMVAPFRWSDFPAAGRPVFEGFRSPAGEELILGQNLFIERVLPGSVLRVLGDEEMKHYRCPFLNAGEDRRPTLSWPRDIPIDGEPADVVAIFDAYSAWLAESEVPKLFITAPRLPYCQRPDPRLRQDMAEPDRGHRRRTALRPRGQSRRDRCRRRRFRAAATHTK
jgi:haloalkane dehalogenase